MNRWLKVSDGWINDQIIYICIVHRLKSLRMPSSSSNAGIHDPLNTQLLCSQNDWFAKGTTLHLTLNARAPAKDARHC